MKIKSRKKGEMKGTQNLNLPFQMDLNPFLLLSYQDLSFIVQELSQNYEVLGYNNNTE
jgi:hypothetical protein